MRPRGRGRTEKRSGTSSVIELTPVLAEPEAGTSLVPNNRVSHSTRSAKSLAGQSPYSLKGPITTLCAFIKGGKETFMELASMAPNIEPELACVIEEYEHLIGPAKIHCDLDQLCKDKGVDPAHFMGVVSEAAMKFRDNASLIIAAVNMPSVVKKSVAVALTNKGVKDREMLFRHSRFLPLPAGINIKNEANAAAQATTNGAVTALRTFEHTMSSVEED